jgi:hypothetical protein
MPDGKQIVFAGNVAGQAVRCFIQNIDGGKPRPITPEGVSMCEVSPDGQTIAAGDLNGYKLYPMDGGPPRPLAGLLPGEVFHWTADPQFVYAYQAHKLAPGKVYRLNIVSGQRQLFKEIIPSDEVGLCGMSKISFSANGRAYVYGFVRQLSELYLVNGVK